MLSLDHSTSLREGVEWLRGYYALKGLDYSQLRQDIILRYSWMVDFVPFSKLLNQYIYHLYSEHLEEMCHVSNDNDWVGVCCASPYHYYADIDYPEYDYPGLSMRVYHLKRGDILCRYGYMSHKNLVRSIAHSPNRF
ncbi:MAG TPA: hypothetical protein PLK94_07930 [Alphaproteobacteria bacterium]|nr:hypothetical protein [Alphaproteobacteria bacterium]